MTTSTILDTFEARVLDHENPVDALRASLASSDAAPASKRLAAKIAAALVLRAARQRTRLHLVTNTETST